MSSLSPALPDHPIARANVLVMTLDTLRMDVAREALARGQTPHLARLLPRGEWEERHAPGSFTYASHHAMFAGFFPTPARPDADRWRVLALAFSDSTTVTDGTLQLDAPDLPTGFARLGHHTICIGGVGFFNKQNALGRVLPGLFAESHWAPEFGVSDPRSPEHQFRAAAQSLGRLEAGRRAFLFLNVSAMHQPTHFYVPGAQTDSVETQRAALAAMDAQLPLLTEALQGHTRRSRAPWYCIVCSDHGTAFGEDGYWGHRLSHPVVWTVPYAEFWFGVLSL
ncbi:MAG: STM4013/SEN3800 family hydrolase [Sumerlaeia bacterium]